MKVLDPITLRHDDVEDTTITQVDTDEPSGTERLLRNVSIPTLTPYLPDPDKATGTAVVVVPGGALHFLAITNEGERMAERLVEQGIAAFVLRYRLAPTPVEPAEVGPYMDALFADRANLSEVSQSRRGPALEDGTAALRTVRANAEEWGIDPQKVGMVGFSAGGFVTLATLFDSAPEDRPAFAAPIYPAWWDDVVVPQPAPPMFLTWATNDQLNESIVPSCLRLYAAWQKAGAQVEAHAYVDGGHGFGARIQGDATDAWFDVFASWIRRVGF